jgi:hypothetical protein
LRNFTKAQSKKKIRKVNILEEGTFQVDIGLVGIAVGSLAVEDTATAGTTDILAVEVVVAGHTAMEDTDPVDKHIDRTLAADNRPVEVEHMATVGRLLAVVDMAVEGRLRVVVVGMATVEGKRLEEVAVVGRLLVEATVDRRQVATEGMAAVGLLVASELAAREQQATQELLVLLAAPLESLLQQHLISSSPPQHRPNTQS